MNKMRLKLNPDKTEFALFGSKVQLSKTITNSFKAEKDNIQRSSEVKCLGVTLDQHLNMKAHCKKTGTKSYVKLYKDQEYSEVSYN